MTEGHKSIYFSFVLIGEEDEGDGVAPPDLSRPPSHLRLPDAVLAGAKKGGTKALLSILSTHPGLVRCRREVHFFDMNFRKGWEWYAEQVHTPWVNGMPRLINCM